MAILKAQAQQGTAVGRVSEGDDVELRATRDGSLFTADWKQAMMMEGRVFMINIGALSTGVDGGGTGTIVDIDCPSGLVSVPSGTSILPLRVGVSIGLPVGKTDDDEVDVLIAVDQDKAWDATGTWTSETIYNANTLHSRASNCTARSVCTATTTDPVLDIELAHYTKVFELHTSVGVIWTNVDFLYEPKTMPIINGPAMLLLYFGGSNTTQGFADIQWIELPTSAL